jgi:hypothetical protein
VEEGRFEEGSMRENGMQGAMAGVRKHEGGKMMMERGEGESFALLDAAKGRSN